MSNRLPNIALVGKATDEDIDTLEALLTEEDLTDLCEITLYGNDDQPEQEALADAIEDWQDGKVQGIVCLPMQQSPMETVKQSLSEEAENAIPVLVNSMMRMASCKGDVSISDAAVSLNKEELTQKIQQLSKALKRDFYILNPRIAVLSLNKEISDSETSEEINIIAPVVSECVKEGIQAFGPLAAGTFFETDDFKAYDAVLAMYDSQCKEAFINASIEETITLVSGMNVPFALAEPEGILKAFYAVIDAARNRTEYDRPFRNPLQKLYHERKEDGDKARFAIKKKGFNPAEHRRENITFTTIRTPRPAQNPSAEANNTPAQPDSNATQQATDAK